MHRLSPLLLSAVLLATACEPLENPRPDGGDAPDASVSPDAGDAADAGDATDAGLEPDAGTEPDAGGPPDAGARDVDWRTVRGAPWQTTVVGEYPGAEPFAMTDAGFVLVSGCDAGACDYEFRDRAGALLQKRLGLRPLFGTTVSPTGAFASLFEGTSSLCTRSNGSSITFWSGAWHLVDLASGESAAVVSPLLTAGFSDPAFLRRGGHARLVPAVLQGCGQDRPLLRMTTPPFTEPAAASRMPSYPWPIDELADGSLVVAGDRNGLEAVTLFDPRGAAFDLQLNDDVDSILPAGDFLHATSRHPVREFTSFDLTQRRLLRTPVPWTERDHLPRGVSDRFIALCDQGVPLRRCEVRDGLQEIPTTVLAAQTGQGYFPFAIAGKARFVVYAHDAQLWRRSLITGEETLVYPRQARVRTVGDGRAVVVVDDQVFVAIDADRVFTFPGALRGVVDPALTGASHDAPQANTLLVVTASASGGENWLHAWNTATGRIARLTDSLFFNPPFQAPLTAADLCNAPGFVRSAGRPFESGFVQAKLLHFTEFVPAVQPQMRLFVMPVDLSAPPRLIAEVPSGLCGTPLATPAGDRLWMPVPMPSGGVRGVMATP